MTESWKDFEGQVADAQFHLRRYLGGSDYVAVFLTELGEGQTQQAAIKLSPADPDAAETQLSRWRQAAKLSHPNLLRIFQAGRCRLGERNMLYVVTEYAAEDLSQILPQRPLTASETRDMLGPILDALSYLHLNGFVHGHIKPANIMAVDEQLKISSDGLCRAGRPSAGRSKPGPYDAPEFPSSVASPSGDIWALGMTLVEGLTQRLPTWEHIREEEPSLPDNLPPEFRDLARHCLHRDPVRRWTVVDLTRWLQPAAAAPTPVAQQRESASRPTASARKYTNWRYVVPAGAMAVLVIAMLAGPKLFTGHMEARPAVSENARPAVRPASQPKATRHEAPMPEAKKPEPKIEAAAPAPPPPPAPAPAPISAKPAASASKPAGGIVKGEVLEQVLPQISEKARGSIEGKVRVSVRVRVDPSGKVVGAVFDSRGPSKYFAEQANNAALRWKFFPATVNGQNVPSEWILQFEFTKSGTTVHPSQAGQ
jgi:TonB family protein